MIERIINISVRREPALSDHWTRIVADIAALGNDAPIALERFDESVVLTTCERAELIGLVPHWAAPAEILAHLRVCGGSTYAVTTGLAACRHVLRVAAGLDSRLVGETHILGQVRRAFGDARQTGASGHVLGRLGQRAIRAGRLVRTQTDIGRVPTSYAALAVAWLARECSAVANPRIGVLGSGALGRDVVRQLAAHGVEQISVFCRHPQRVHADSTFGQTTIRSLDDLPTTLGLLDGLIAAAKSSRTLVGYAEIVGRSRPLAAVDLGAPANIESAVAGLPDVRLITIDELMPDRRFRQATLGQAEAIVERQLVLLQRDFNRSLLASCTGRATA